jgi:carboxyl-terminal processing protease
MVSRRFAVVVALGCAVFVSAQERAGSHIKQTESDGQIIRNVANLLEYAHLKQFKIDHEISRRMHKLYVESFDPKKLFFLESDLKELADGEFRHTDYIRNGDLGFAIRVYERFLKRVTERNEWAAGFAKEKFDFAQEDTIVVDNKTATYAKNDDEAKARWRAWIKYELCTMIVDGVKEPEARERIAKRYRNLLRFTKQTDKDELLERYLTCLTNSFDPHSTYMSPKSQEEFDIAMRLQLQGIGALLGGEDGRTTIKEILPGGAAESDKRLKPGDRITGVGQGEAGEMVDVDEMKLSDVVKMIRGEAGTKVRLEVIPANSEKRVVYVLTRQKVTLADKGAKGEIFEAPHPGQAGGKYRVGVVKLPSFYADNAAIRVGAADARSATADVRRILEDFKVKGVDAVVMDLRNNGGGLLQEAISVTGLFIDTGPVVQVKDFAGKTRRHFDEAEGAAYDGPLVVLVNKFSASASEIFAGAVQDYKRGLVVGDASTHGKGSVQQVVDLGDKNHGALLADNANQGALKVTLQMFYRVNGDSTQNRGVVSDVVLPSASDREDFSESKLDYALEFDRISPAGHRMANMVAPQDVEELKKRSAARRAANPDFAKLAKLVAKVRELADRKTIAFTEAKLRQQKAERKELLALDEAVGDDEDDASKPVAKKKEKKFGEDAYDKEVLAIVGDYVNLHDRSVTQR